MKLGEYYWDDTQTPRTISEDTSSRNAAYPKTDDSVDTLTGGFSNASLTTSSKEYSSPHYITSGSPVASSHSNPASSNLSGSSNTTADYASGPSYTANAASSSSVIQSGFDTGGKALYTAKNDYSVNLKCFSRWQIATDFDSIRFWPCCVPVDGTIRWLRK